MIEKITSRLDGVRMTGKDRAVARCPAHNDKTPSLSIRETEDGTILIKCFAGCGAADVLSAIGLELVDLFPESERRPHSKSMKPNHWHATTAALKTLHKEVVIVVLAANVISRNAKLSTEDCDRLLLAATRIREAAEFCK